MINQQTAITLSEACHGSSAPMEPAVQCFVLITRIVFSLDIIYRLVDVFFFERLDM